MAYKNIEDRRAYHRKYAREEYAWLKARNRCVICKKQDAYTLNGRAWCFECAEKKRGHPYIERKKKEYPPKIPRHERFAYGLCFLCGNSLDGVIRADGEEAHVCSKCMKIEERNAAAARMVPKRPMPPLFYTKSAIESYRRLKADYESKTMAKSSQIPEK